MIINLDINILNQMSLVQVQWDIIGNKGHLNINMPSYL